MLRKNSIGSAKPAQQKFVFITASQALKSISGVFLVIFFCLCNHIAQGQTERIAQELHGLPFIKDSVNFIDALNRLGTLYRSRNIDSCFHYGIKAKRIAASLNYEKGQTDADQLIAYAFFKRGLYAESLALFGKVLPHYEKSGDTEKIIRVYLDMVEVLNKGISERTKIISLLQKAIHTGRKLEKDSIMSEVYMSYCNRNSNLPADSINHYLSKSLEIANRYKDERMLIFIRLWQARLLILNDQKPKALPLTRQLILDSRRIGSSNLQINALFLMTGFYEKQPKKALNYLYQAHQVALKSGDRSLEIYILNNALEFANQIGDKDEIIKVYIELEKAMSTEWEKSRKFINDYVSYNNIQDANKLLIKKNARGTTWLLLISIAAFLLLLAFYLMMVYRSRKARAQIEALNNVANMQIIAMEEAKHQAVREEQQRLGQDLHDGLSSSIAAIRYQLEVLLMDTKDIALKNKLSMLRHETENAYKAARNKSHEWFGAGDEQQEQSFEKQIKLLTDSSLPDNHYNKTIHIDNSALVNVGTDTRIALLRIIQEAITNIIKHAKARNVGVLIYEEEDNLLLTINDDGIGLDEKKLGNGKSTMGLQSIRRRVQSLNGETKIDSDTKGTEIVISIPVLSS